MAYSHSASVYSRLVGDLSAMASALDSHGFSPFVVASERAGSTDRRLARSSMLGGGGADSKAECSFQEAQAGEDQHRDDREGVTHRRCSRRGDDIGDEEP